jgi:2-oxoglutarate ferredoxin oxidoreductase subunit alpha
MTKLRAAKVAGVANDIPLAEVDDPGGNAEVLVVGWGSTYGAIQAGLRRVRAQGREVAHLHLRHLNPFPTNVAEIVGGYRKILVPEMNLGQLVKLLRADFLVDAKGLNKTQGKPFKAEEIEAAVLDLILERA